MTEETSNDEEKSDFLAQQAAERAKRIQREIKAYQRNMAIIGLLIMASLLGFFKFIHQKTTELEKLIQEREEKWLEQKRIKENSPLLKKQKLY